MNVFWILIQNATHANSDSQAVSVGKVGLAAKSVSDQILIQNANEADLAGLALNTHIYNEKLSLRWVGFDNSGKFLPSRNLRSCVGVGPGNAISVEDLRYAEDGRRGGPADTLRAHNSDMRIL